MRCLTEKETALCRAIFPDEIPYAAVRLCDGPGRSVAAKLAFGRGNTAITLRRKVHFGTRYCADFTEADARAQQLFVHEMTHVWQWHRLGVVGFLLRYGRDLLVCKGDAKAMYRYEKGVTPFADAMLEAQAQMAGDYRSAVVAGDAVEKALIAKNIAGSGLF